MIIEKLRYRKTYRVFAVLLTTLLLIFSAFKFSNSEAKDICHIPIKRWAYTLGERKLSKNSIPYLEKYLSRLNLLCITGYRLNGKGKLIRSINKDRLNKIIKICRRYSVDLFPLVSLKSSAQGKKMLAASNARTRAIDEIANLVNGTTFKGVQIDFEYLPPNHIKYLSIFLAVLKKRLHGKKLTMAIFPPVDFPRKWAGFHDMRILGPLLDEIVLMCYDYHRRGTVPGPVTDIEWAEKNIRQILKYISPGQVWLGVPTYGYRWRGSNSTSVITARRGVKLSRIYRASRHKSGTVFIEYKKDGKINTIYYADKTTRQLMTGLARRYKLKGTALWRLGFED